MVYVHEYGQLIEQAPLGIPSTETSVKMLF